VSLEQHEYPEDGQQNGPELMPNISNLARIAWTGKIRRKSLNNPIIKQNFPSFWYNKNSALSALYYEFN